MCETRLRFFRRPHVVHSNYVPELVPHVKENSVIPFHVFGGDKRDTKFESVGLHFCFHQYIYKNVCFFSTGKLYTYVKKNTRSTLCVPLVES